MKLFLVYLSLFGMLNLLGCDSDLEQSKPEVITSEQAANPKTEGLVLAVHPYDIPSKVQLHFQPILNYLSQTLGQKVSLYVATSYEDQIRQIATGKVDFAYLGPSSFIKARDNYVDDSGRKVQAIATEKPYQGAVVVHKDSQMNSLQDLKNHSFAFGSYYSYAGHFVIREALKENGVRLADLQLYSFLGRHERAVLSVAYGDFDAAATTLGIADRMQALKYPVKVIYTSKLLAPIVLVAGPQVDSVLVNKIKKLLLNPSFEGQEMITMFAPGGSFFPYDEGVYEEVRKTVALFEQ
ncbi:PhnD/SsuA/transferrin family substrate-binding protein [Thiomicrorhabdus sp. Kp2]|uniref:PhnD/SsuA/transferrin family substrate-binding protein n=1 Tax=Thiomicrorhabdus sp. Kp2 TaxID=1123518 RepID=UPI0003F4FE7F|nr:PhnD/SsuA/transferrin family substrate-binding protein [Thiomicrorhabdus sp. Kp2]